MNMKHIVFVFALGFVLSDCARSDNSLSVHSEDYESREYITLNLIEGQIGPINRTESIETIKNIIGTENVNHDTIIIKGEEVRQYQIDIEGEYLYLVNRTFRIVSPRFRTENDLGTGSTIGAFEDTFGSGVLGESDLAEPIDYYDGEGRYLFSIVVDATCITFESDRVQFLLTCAVREIWL